MDDVVEQPEVVQDSATETSQNPLAALADRMMKSGDNQPSSDENVEQQASTDEAPSHESEMTPVDNVEEVKAKIIALFNDEEAQYQIDDEVLGSDELKSRMLRQSDYTKKTQELAEQRKQLETESSEYQSKLEFLGYSNAAALQKYQTVNWQQLQASDPAEYQKRLQEYRQLQQRDQVLSQSWHEFQKHKQKQLDDNRISEAKGTLELLKVEIPDWNNDLYMSLADTAESYGIEKGKFLEMTDAGFMRLVYDAHQFKQAKTNASLALKKQAESAPKQKAPTPQSQQISRQVRDRMHTGDRIAVREAMGGIAKSLLKGK